MAISVDEAHCVSSGKGIARSVRPMSAPLPASLFATAKILYYVIINYIICLTTLKYILFTRAHKRAG